MLRGLEKLHYTIKDLDVFYTKVQLKSIGGSSEFYLNPTIRDFRSIITS